MRQITLLLGGFLGQNVAVEGMLPLDFAGASQLKTLLGGRIGFILVHITKPLRNKQAAKIRKKPGNECVTS